MGKSKPLEQVVAAEKENTEGKTEEYELLTDNKEAEDKPRELTEYSLTSIGQKGLIYVCGDKGSGKTTLCHNIISKIPTEKTFVLVSNERDNVRYQALNHSLSNENSITSILVDTYIGMIENLQKILYMQKQARRRNIELREPIGMVTIVLDSVDCFLANSTFRQMLLNWKLYNLRVILISNDPLEINRSLSNATQIFIFKQSSPDIKKLYDSYGCSKTDKEFMEDYEVATREKGACLVIDRTHNNGFYQLVVPTL